MAGRGVWPYAPTTKECVLIPNARHDEVLDEGACVHTLLLATTTVREPSGMYTARKPTPRTDPFGGLVKAVETGMGTMPS